MLVNKIQIFSIFCFCLRLVTVFRADSDSGHESSPRGQKCQKCKKYQKCQNKMILGTLYDTQANTTVSLDHRLAKGEACCWKHRKTLTGPGSIPQKLQAWQAAPVAVAVLGACTWHLSSTYRFACDAGSSHSCAKFSR